MKKKYMFELEEIKGCKEECPCYDSEYMTCNLKEYSGDKNNCVTELKPNKLDWNLLDVTGLYSALNGKYTITVSRELENQPVYYSCFFLGMQLENMDTLNNAKQFCQDYCDSLFSEMIGVKNEIN